MAIYKNSRYKGSYVYSDINDRDKIYLDVIQQPKFYPSKEDMILEFKEGDRLDIIANKVYGDESLDWVILQANPSFLTSFDIKAGDLINVPSLAEVMEVMANA